MIEFEIELIGVVRFGLAGGVKRGDGGPKGHAGWVVGPPWARWTSLSAIHPDRISQPVKLIRLCLATPSFANQLNNNNRNNSLLNCPKKFNSTLLLQTDKKEEDILNMVRVKQSRSSIMHCVKKFTCLYIFKELGSNRQDVTGILNVIRVWKNRPVFLLSRIYPAAHFSCTPGPDQHIECHCSTTVWSVFLSLHTPYFYQLFLSCVSSLYFYPAFLFPISVLQQFLVILSCISILYLSHPFQVQTDA